MTLEGVSDIGEGELTPADCRVLPLMFFINKTLCLNVMY